MPTPLIIAALVIGAVWAVYLLPAVFGERGAAISSTEEYDRWTHSMAHVQKHTAADLAASRKDLIRARRRRTIGALIAMALGGFFAAIYLGSLQWLLVGLFFASLILLYGALLAQVKQRRLQLLKVAHVADRPTEWDEPQVKVIAN